MYTERMSLYGKKEFFAEILKNIIVDLKIILLYHENSYVECLNNVAKKL